MPRPLTLNKQIKMMKRSTDGKHLLAWVPALPSPTRMTPESVSSNPWRWYGFHYTSHVRELMLPKEVEGRPDITIDLSAPGAVESLKDKPFTIKEGCTYQMKASFVVQRDVLSGLKYVQVVKRRGIRVSKDQEMIGSYPPNTTDKPLHITKFAAEEAPSGMLARGKYEAVSKFIDDDDVTHLKFEWSFHITKDW